MIIMACWILGSIALGLFVGGRMVWCEGKDVMSERDYYAP